jgi:hypothetical protein
MQREDEIQYSGKRKRVRERMDRQNKEKNYVSCCKWVLGLGGLEQERTLVKN